MNKKFISNKELEKYKKFALKEDMLKMSIAFILGAAFNNVVKGISDLLIMPFINFILLHTGESWRSFEVEPADGLVLELGKFLGTCVDFVLISIILYLNSFRKTWSGKFNFICYTKNFKSLHICELKHPSCSAIIT